jgi:polyhydroxyalkanoate synthesis regulator phasin
MARNEDDDPGVPCTPEKVRSSKRRTEQPMKRSVIALAVIVAVIGGAFALVAVNPLGTAGAQRAGVGPTEHRAGRQGALDEALDQLVEEGTLTEEQASAVRDRKRDTVTERRERRSGEQRDSSRPKSLRKAFDKAGGEVATALGLSPEELSQGLRDGKTLGELADENGVDRSELAQVLVDRATARIDAAAADGRIDDEKADAHKSELGERVERFLDRNVGGQGGRKSRSGD